LHRAMTSAATMSPRPRQADFGANYAGRARERIRRVDDEDRRSRPGRIRRTADRRAYDTTSHPLRSKLGRDEAAPIRRGDAFARRLLAVREGALGIHSSPHSDNRRPAQRPAAVAAPSLRTPGELTVVAKYQRNIPPASTISSRLGSIAAGRLTLGLADPPPCGVDR